MHFIGGEISATEVQIKEVQSPFLMGMMDQNKWKNTTIIYPLKNLKHVKALG